jgi:hypothetical protein
MNLKMRSFWILLTVILFSTAACDNSNEGETAPDLPPYSSMVMDFEDFDDNQANAINNKSMAEGNNHWLYSRAVVGVWNTALITTLAVPVASFKTAFSHKPVYQGNAKWQWAYTVEGFTSQYTARLTGELAGDEVVWEMYVTKNGIGAFDEFLWFSGKSQIDGQNGHWILNHSAAFPEDMLRIDWAIANEEIGNIKYTYVRELDYNRDPDTFKDSYINYGLQSGDLDAFYDVHAFNQNLNKFVDVNIEWNRTNYNGQVMAPDYFNDTNWHCWNGAGEDIDCP